MFYLNVGDDPIILRNLALFTFDAPVMVYCDFCTRPVFRVIAFGGLGGEVGV